MTKPRRGDSVRVRAFDGTVAYVNDDGTLDITPEGSTGRSINYVPPVVCELTHRAIFVGDRLGAGSAEPPISSVVTAETVDGVVVWMRTTADKWCSDQGDFGNTWAQVVLECDLLTVVHVPLNSTTERKPAT